MSEGKTPGRAAAIAYHQAGGTTEDRWEAAAQAAIAAAPPAIIQFKDGELSEADVAELREKFAAAVRSNRPPAVVTSGTEHLAELIGSLAIGGEEPA